MPRNARSSPRSAFMSVVRAPTKPTDQHASLKLHRDPECGEVSIGEEAARIMENLTDETAGTIAAVTTITLGVAPNSAQRTGEGGARNHSCRESYALRRAQVENLLAATSHACKVGLPFNRMITVHWEAAGIPLRGMAQATGHFIDLLSKTVARNGGRIAWAWVHEGGDKKGGHAHILVHVPEHVIDVVTRLQKGWLRAITGVAYRRGVIRTKPIGPRRGVEMSNPPLHQENLNSAVFYILKGCAIHVAEEVGVRRLEPGGRVIGKRCGTSQNIGPKARAARRAKSTSIHQA